jgi:hypothetical protein
MSELIPIKLNGVDDVSFLLKRKNTNYEYSFDFEVFEVISWSENEKTGCVDVPHEIEPYISGFIKWDGCCHFYFGGDIRGYLHLCGKDCIEKHHKIIDYLYDLAKKTIKFFDD